MVKKGVEMDDFDSIRFETALSDLIVIGDTTETITNEMELYDKNLVLTSKWDKLPVLEKICFRPYFIASLANLMENSALEGLRVDVTIYNCELDDIDDDHIIDVASIYVGQDAGVMSVIQQDHFDADYNIPLRNKVTISVTTTTNEAVAGANLAASVAGFKLLFNIDWIKYTPEQLKDWILKEIFIDQ